ncbi:MAG: hypothetical protein OXP70_07840 [Acidobacteriota bacterium]|nr:hypothetical protein [Acidobacteriota bacterium]
MTHLRRLFLVFSALLVSAFLASCSKGFTPPDPLDIRTMAIYDDASCASLDAAYGHHESSFHEINDNLAGNAAKNVAKIAGFGLLALADGDLSGDKRRAARDTHLDHMQYISTTGMGQECEGYPKGIPTDLND